MTIPFCSVEEDKADKEHFENVSVREKTLTEQVAHRDPSIMYEWLTKIIMQLYDCILSVREKTLTEQVAARAVFKMDINSFLKS